MHTTKNATKTTILSVKQSLPPPDPNPPTCRSFTRVCSKKKKNTYRITQPQPSFPPDAGCLPGLFVLREVTGSVDLFSSTAEFDLVLAGSLILAPPDWRLRSPAAVSRWSIGKRTLALITTSWQGSSAPSPLPVTCNAILFFLPTPKDLLKLTFTEGTFYMILVSMVLHPEDHTVNVRPTFSSPASVVPSGICMTRLLKVHCPSDWTVAESLKSSAETRS